MTVTQIETILGFGFPGGYEWIILLILGLLIFGRRLPEVGRSLGKSIVEFTKGIKNIEDEIETESPVPAGPCFAGRVSESSTPFRVVPAAPGAKPGMGPLVITITPGRMGATFGG